MDYEKMRKHWDRATSYERTFLAMHPFLVKVIEENARKATDETVRRFGRNGYNDSSDAFRHCYFSALLTRDLGLSNARFFMDAHELFEGNPEEEFRMDMHNNHIGFRLGIFGGDDLTLADRCYAALQQNKLKVISP